MSPPLNSEDLRRLNTWAGAIAPVLRPDAPIAHTAEGLRVGRKGSLSIASDCRWFDHESGKGGRYYRRLVELPKSLHEQVTQVVPREWKARR